MCLYELTIRSYASEELLRWQLYWKMLKLLAEMLLKTLELVIGQCKAGIEVAVW